MDNIMKKAEGIKVTIIPYEKEIDQIIFDHVGFSMLAGAIPIPVLDIIAVSAIQVDMLKKIAKKYEIEFDDEIGKSIVSSIIGTTIGTSIGRAGASAVKVIPGIGTLLGIGSQIVLSGITTYAIGHLFNQHFGNHKPLSDFNFNDVKDVFEALLKKGKDIVENMQKNAKHSEENIKEQTTIVLRTMAEKGVIKQSDYEKIVNELNK